MAQLNQKLVIDLPDLEVLHMQAIYKVESLEFRTPNLSQLSLMVFEAIYSRNSVQRLPLPLTVHTTSLRSLILESMAISTEDLTSIASSNPKIEEFHIKLNGLVHVFYFQKIIPLLENVENLTIPGQSFVYVIF